MILQTVYDLNVDTLKVRVTPRHDYNPYITKHTKDL